MVADTNGSQVSTKRLRRGGFITTLARYRTLLLSFTIGGAVLFAALSFILPQTYESVSTVLPPERHGAGGMLSMLANSSALDLLKGSDNPTLDLFKTIIDSRNIAEEVARDPRVRGYFGKEDTSLSSIAGAVQGTLTSEALRSGMFTVTVDVKTHALPSQKEIDSARKMSAYLANKYVTELDRFNRDRLITNARATRIFIEHEYNNRMAQLDSGYKVLQAFQEQNKTISLPDQLTATVTAAAKLTGEIQQLEMQLGVEQHEMSPNSTRIQMLNAQLASAKAQLQKYDDGGIGDYVLALKNVPELSRSLAKYLREAKVLEQVTAYLRQELEQERISEQRDLPSLQVLDSAQVPQKRSSPHRSVMTLIGTLVGLVVGCIVISTKNFMRSVRERPEQHYRFINFVNAVRRGEKAKMLTPVVTASTNGATIERVTEHAGH